MNEKVELAQEWFDRGNHDLEGACILFEAQHHTDTIAFLIQQAAEKYLKGFLLFKGWRLQKVHDLEKLISEAMTYDESFSNYLDFARRATAYYVEERYPPGPAVDYPRNEIQKGLLDTTELVQKINVLVKQETIKK
jgi:HEPN domain-containing protein